MRYKKPFSLFSRKTKDGTKVYYYRYYKNGKRVSGKSTGMTDRLEAYKYVLKLYSEGKL